MRRHLATALALGLVTLAVGCGGVVRTKAKPRAPARDGVQELIAALRSDDPRVAYSMLAPEARADVKYDEFAKQWKATTRERKHQARALEDGLKENPNVGERSRVVYQDGQAIHLKREGNAWKLESALVSRYHAGRPEDAVRLFAAALADRNYDAAMRLLTNRRRKAISKRVEGFITSLVAHQGTAVERIGEDRAELYWEDDEHTYKVVLRKDGDEWRVDDLHIRAAPPKATPEISGGSSDEDW